MSTGPIKRPSLIRPVYRGHRGKTTVPVVGGPQPRHLPAIAAAFGIGVDELIDTAKRIAA